MLRCCGWDVATSTAANDDGANGATSTEVTLDAAPLTVGTSVVLQDGRSGKIIQIISVHKKKEGNASDAQGEAVIDDERYVVRLIDVDRAVESEGTNNAKTHNLGSGKPIQHVAINAYGTYDHIHQEFLSDISVSCVVGPAKEQADSASTVSKNEKDAGLVHGLKRSDLRIVSPEEGANFFSRALFLWATKMLDLAQVGP